jgi:hypothetical protein
LQRRAVCSACWRKVFAIRRCILAIYIARGLYSASVGDALMMIQRRAARGKKILAINERWFGEVRIFIGPMQILVCLDRIWVTVRSVG